MSEIDGQELPGERGRERIKWGVETISAENDLNEVDLARQARQ